MATTTTRRSSNRASSQARDDIITMLKDDHKRAKKAFRDFEKLDPHEDAEQCEAIVQRTCAELELHSMLEEELLYPAARSVLGEEDLVDEAEVEHMTAKLLIAQLKDMTAEDDKYGATFTVLGEYIKHHVKEEEGEMFPQLGRARLDWEQLCNEMKERRAELEQELLPEQAAAESDTGVDAEEDDDTMVAPAKRGAGARAKNASRDRAAQR